MSSALADRVSHSVRIRRAITDGYVAEISQKAIEVAITLTAGAYQTSLVSYFTHRDLFPCLMKVSQEECFHTRDPNSSL